MPKILITGVAGMIGSELAHYFDQNPGPRGQYKLVGIDDLSGGFLRNIPVNVRFYPVSITNRNAVENIFRYERPQYVIHCACFAAEVLSPFVRNFIYENIILGTTNIINASVNHDVEKIVHFSSIARYGDIRVPFREGDVPKPIDCYGMAKLFNEQDLEEAKQHFGLKYSVVAPHNVVTPRQNFCDPYRNVVAIFIRQYLARENITIFGDGSQTRSFSHAQYLCRPVERLLYDFDGALFNIGSDEKHSILDIANLVIKVGKQKIGYCQSKIIHLEPRREVKHAHSSHERAKFALNFQDKTDMEKLVSDMFDYANALMPLKEPKKREYEITKNLYSFWR